MVSIYEIHTVREKRLVVFIWFLLIGYFLKFYFSFS